MLCFSSREVTKGIDWWVISTKEAYLILDLLFQTITTGPVAFICIIIRW